MRKVLKLIFFLLFYSAPIILEAQQKYALLVGVNDYYQDPGVKHPHSLSGCVNDAKAIKGLLENRFGFSSSNVFTLFNQEANRKKLIDMLRMIFHKAKAGDAVVFYFSGHGVWMTNRNLDTDTIKRGMSQAIVMSDLYSPGWDCLVRDETMKDIINQFVDKKIIFTSIFDCCYSGNLMMLPEHSLYWKGWFTAPPRKKDFQIDNIPYMPITVKPIGCPVDSSGAILPGLTDTDSDGVPDCMDWEIHTPPLTLVDLQGAAMEAPIPYEFISRKDNYYDSATFAKEENGDKPLLLTRSFNLKDALSVTNASAIRPSDKKNSAFLSCAASADNQKALEITGVGGNKHGAFTEALLAVYSKNPSSLPVADLIKKINVLMIQQTYRQSPSYHFDSSRLKGNLIGISSTGFSNKPNATCIANKNGTITLNKGLHAGIFKGNTLTATNPATRQTIQIVEAYADSAIAKPKNAAAIKPGHVFEKTDPYTISSPLLKVYIPSVSFTPVSFETFFNQKVSPQTVQKNYLDYYLTENDQVVRTITWEDAGNNIQFDDPLMQGKPNAGGYIVLLPIPSYIAAAVKSSIAKNQNIEIVQDASKADLVLYLNYVRKRPGVKAGFVFYFHPKIIGTVAFAGPDIFSKQHAQLPTMNPGVKELQVLSNKLAGIAHGMIRSRTSTWINDYPRR